LAGKGEVRWEKTTSKETKIVEGESKEKTGKVSQTVLWKELGFDVTVRSKKKSLDGKSTPECEGEGMPGSAPWLERDRCERAIKHL